MTVATLPTRKNQNGLQKPYWISSKISNDFNTKYFGYNNGVFPLQNIEKGVLLWVMKMFRYNYQGDIVQSEVEYYMDRGAHRYRVVTETGYCVVVPLAFPGPNGMTLWVQSVKPGEIEYPHDLVQAMGEGIEQSGMPVLKQGANEN